MNRDSYIELTGLTWCNHRVGIQYLPGREISDGLLYHMFATGLFDSVVVKQEFETDPVHYDRAKMSRYVQERDRLEIRRLKAELLVAREQPAQSPSK